MAKFKVVMTFPDGEVIDSYEEDGDEGIFDTEQEANDYFCEWMSNYSAGGDVIFQTLVITLLKWSNKNQITR